MSFELFKANLLIELYCLTQQEPSSDKYELMGKLVPYLLTRNHTILPEEIAVPLFALCYKSGQTQLFLTVLQAMENNAQPIELQDMSTN